MYQRNITIRRCKEAGEARKVLAQEIHDNLLVMESKHGGHFGPNLAFAEATIALHTVFNCRDCGHLRRLAPDVSPLKMPTGRKQIHGSCALRLGVSFTPIPPRPRTLLQIGHTSTSTAWRWPALATSWRQENIIAVIGDLIYVRGEASGLNVADELNSNLSSL